MERMLITGASRGIGEAIALGLAGPGRELILHGRDAGALAKVAVQVGSRGAAARVVVADLRASEGIATLVTAGNEGPLAALIHNAGIGVVKPVEKITLGEWRRSLDIMLTAPFLLSRDLLPSLSAGSSIVHVLSVAARRGFPGWGAYCAAKFALEGFSQCLREELRPRGIRVINIYPAATDSTLWDGVQGEWSRDRMLPPAEVAEAVAYALGRPASALVEGLSIGHVSGAL
ncbi:MAG TPA: SDR family NAD(P)-dependent oxidoreductase [Thermoanaerobaculaceae bacterium]|nr:SDR family NAD(P)-dependent oxidoreductase [Thermoanaerobaculaceae bacterium]HPS78450.1 SDR family NAD(P)-dependent oxidoreductase [Thermoanaerobaculaceae bacterium]